MKIYTKTGDSGTTALFGGARVSKNSLRINAYGTVDETNAILGQASSFLPADSRNSQSRKLIQDLQNQLFIVGADLATPLSSKASVPRIANSEVLFLERSIDRLESNLPELKQFILPGGSKSASILHFARTVCRRAERIVVELSQTENINPETIVYLNRLSDLLFVFARHQSFLDDMPEIPWTKC